jgi:pSer/pThr/pTyr-binding forkhead associated (FHA) protein
MMARLILTLNNKTIGSYKIAQGQQLTIGRHSTNDICIDNVAVSAHHATISFENQMLILTDLGSRNATLVNGSQVEVYNLAHQDWISFGKHICIVDLYESMPPETLESSDRAPSPASVDALETMCVDRKELESGYMSIDYLSLLKTGQQDFELTHRPVKIGKNKDADIKIRGLSSLLAGKPSATISRINGAYIIEHVFGLLKPKINGISIKRPTRLNHQDIIRIGPLEMQIRSVQRPNK